MKVIARYLFLIILIILIWNTIVIKPIKIFTVFLHELGHIIMAFVFGSGITKFNVGLNEAGYTLAKSKGWFSSFMILNGGYLGSILFAILILLSKNTFLRKYILGIISIIFLVISIFYADSKTTLICSIIFAIVIIFMYMVGNENINDWAIDIVGITSAVYAIYDTFVDTILVEINKRFLFFNIHTYGQSDAVRLAKLTQIPAIVWGIIWFFIAIVCLFFVLVKKSKTRRYRR